MWLGYVRLQTTDVAVHGGQGCRRRNIFTSPPHAHPHLLLIVRLLPSRRSWRVWLTPSRSVLGGRLLYRRILDVHDCRAVWDSGKRAWGASTACRYHIFRVFGRLWRKKREYTKCSVQRCPLAQYLVPIMGHSCTVWWRVAWISVGSYYGDSWLTSSHLRRPEP